MGIISLVYVRSLVHFMLQYLSSMYTNQLAVFLLTQVLAVMVQEIRVTIDKFDLMKEIIK